MHAEIGRTELSVSNGLIHWPKLSAVDLGLMRSPGPGLGNLLFPIARALIGQKIVGGDFLYPTMRQIKVGTFLRRERDSRTYGGVIRARSYCDWLLWARSIGLAQKNEHAFDGKQSTLVITYEGLGRYFHDLQGHRAIMSDWLASNVLEDGAIDCNYDIGVHVRLGDFAPVGTAQTGHSVRLSMEWYKRALQNAMAILGVTEPRILLFTDGPPNEVRIALGVSSIRVDPSRNALTAILNLSRARIIVTSRSTFSMWAAYLGAVPAIWDKELDLNQSFPVRVGLDTQV